MNSYTRFVICAISICLVISAVQSRVEEMALAGRAPPGAPDGKEPKGTQVQNERPGDGPTEKPIVPKPPVNDDPATTKKPGGLISGVVGSLDL